VTSTRLSDKRSAQYSFLSTPPASTARVADPPPDADRPLGRRARAAEQIFPTVPASPVTRQQVIVTVGLVLFGVAYLLGRGRPPGVLDSIYAEDGANFLSDAANRPFVEALTRSMNGYYHLYGRLLAEVTTAFPVSWWAPINTTMAVFSTLGLALLVYVASSAHLRHPYLRLLAAAPVVLQYVAHGAAVDNVATLQFPALYALFWLLLQMQVRRGWRMGAPILAGVVALSTTLAVVLIPLALARVALRRDRTGVLLAGALILGVGVQLLGLVTGDADRSGIGVIRLDPLWALIEFVRTQVPVSFLGESWILGRSADPPGVPADRGVHVTEHVALILLGWAIFGAGIGLALRRLTRPAWPLAIVAGGHALVIFVLQVVLIGQVPDRYLVAPMMLLVAAFVALLQPRSWTGEYGVGPAPLVAFATLLLVVSLANYRLDSYRTRHVPSWTTQIRDATAQCRAERDRLSVIVHSGMFRHDFGRFEVPCHRLR
jgi:hypothetical protein